MSEFQPKIYNKMNTYSNKFFNPLEVSKDDICIEDISHALSLLCRGGGQIKYFFSVAQHSINCAKEAQARNLSPRVQLAALLHDASEAYLSDVIRPIKIHLTNYYEIEEMFMKSIYEKFSLDLTAAENIAWKQIDDDILTYELANLMPNCDVKIANSLCTKPDITEKSWQIVEQEFVNLFNELMKEIKDAK